MNLAYFVDEFPPFFRGGLGTYALNICPEFVKLEQNLFVFSRNTGDDPTRDLWRGIEVHRPLLTDLTDILPVIVPEDVKRWPPKEAEFFSETVIYNFLSASKLINVLVSQEKREVDLIVAHDWLAALGGILSKRALGRPLVFHFHSTEQGRTGDGSPTVKEIESLAMRKADLIVTVSYAMRDELVRLGCEEKKIRVVYNGVDPRKYDPGRFLEEEIQAFRSSLGIGAEDPVLLFVGRLTWIKGADSLVQAMPEILGEFPEAKLVILGTGDQEEMIRHQITNLGLGDHVILEAKYVSEEERILHYAACDLTIVPSRYEPFGIVCTEAMSMEKPVIIGARGTSGLREQVIPAGDQRCGSHVNPSDPHDIASFVLELLRDRDLKRRLGENGRRRVLDRFTWEKIARETLDIYEEAAKMGGFE
jgi:glycosyltransferase involved in cell wall biosynthesis